MIFFLFVKFFFRSDLEQVSLVLWTYIRFFYGKYDHVKKIKKENLTNED